MINKLRKHFSDIDNITIYSLFGIVFILALFDKGVGGAVITMAGLGFLISGINVVGYLVFSFKFKDYSFGVGYFISYAYFLGFSIHWLIEYGFSRKAIILTMPIFVGLVISLAHVFGASDTYRRLDKWEKGMLSKIASIFRAKP